MKKSLRTLQHEKETRERRLERAITASAAIFLLAHLIASFFSTARTWGFHHWAFFPLHVRLLLCSGLFVCLPGINRHIIRYGKMVLSNLPSQAPRINRYHVAVALALISSGMFWLLRARTHLLGDGYILIRSIERGNAFIPAEPLDSYIHFLVYRILNGPFGWTGELSYALLSCLLGGCSVFFFVLLSHSIGKDSSRTATVLFSLLSMGSVQLFFGYVESYTLLTCVVLIYILVSLYYIRNRCDIFFPAAILSVALCAHISAAVLVPSLLFLFLGKRRRWRSRRDGILSFVRMTVGAAIPIILLIVLIHQLGFTLEAFREELAQESHILPLRVNRGDPDSFRYSLVSVSHLINIANEALLIAPVALILCISGFIFTASRRMATDHTSIFLSVLGLSYFIYMFLLKPDIGASRDWDLFAAASVPWTLYGARLLVAYPFRKERLTRISLVLVVTALLHTLPWILVNANEEKSVARFEVLAEKDGSWSNVARGIAYDELARFYRVRGLVDKQISYYRKASEAAPNPRYSLNLGSSYYEKGMYEEAISELRRVEDTASSTSRNAHFTMGLAYLRLDSLQEAASEFQRTLEIDPQHGGAHRNLAIAYLMSGRDEEAISGFQRALQIDPNYADAHHNMGVAFFRLGEIEKALSAFQKAARMDPQNADVHYNIGLAYLELNEIDKAISAFKETLRVNPEYSQADYMLKRTERTRQDTSDDK